MKIKPDRVMAVSDEDRGLRIVRFWCDQYGNNAYRFEQRKNAWWQLLFPQHCYWEEIVTYCKPEGSKQWVKNMITHYELERLLEC